MIDAAIATRGLRKQFGTTLAVAGLSLSVRAGEVFGFLGPNGAGKTTAIKMPLRWSCRTTASDRARRPTGQPGGPRPHRREASACLEIEMRVAPLDSGVLEGLARYGTSIARAGEDRVRMRVAGETALPEIARWLVGRGIQVYALQGRRKSLEQWFVEVMGDDQRPG